MLKIFIKGGKLPPKGNITYKSTLTGTKLTVSLANTTVLLFTFVSLHNEANSTIMMSAVLLIRFNGRKWIIFYLVSVNYLTNLLLSFYGKST